MVLTTTLNVVWLLIAVAALTAFALTERNQCAGSRLRRFVAIILLVLSLFPFVSASDDLLGLTCNRNSDKVSQQLVQLLETLHNVQVCSAFAFVLTLFCVGWVFTAGAVSLFCPAPRFAGRAPPVSC